MHQWLQVTLIAIPVWDPAIGATLNVNNIGTAIDGNIRYTIYMNGKLHTHNVHIYDTIPVSNICIISKIAGY